MISQREIKYFDVARSMAKLSTWSNHPAEQLGAVIVLRNEIISTGQNRAKSSELQYHFAKAAGRPEAIYPHAEISCLNKFKRMSWMSKDFHLMKIFVFRETEEGLGLAKPCEICTLALKSFGIKHIYYTSKEGYCYERWE